MGEINNNNSNVNMDSVCFISVTQPLHCAHWQNSVLLKHLHGTEHQSLSAALTIQNVCCEKVHRLHQ